MILLVSLNSDWLLIFLLFHDTLFKQGKSIEGVLHPCISLLAIFPLIRSNWFCDHLFQVAEQEDRKSVNLQRNTGSFRLGDDNGLDLLHCRADQKSCECTWKTWPLGCRTPSKSVEDDNSERIVSKDSSKQQPFSTCSPCMQC